MNEEGKNYLVKVNIYTEQENGKIKTDKKEILVEDAKDINDANDLALKAMAAMDDYKPFDIVGVNESKIAEVIRRQPVKI